MALDQDLRKAWERDQPTLTAYEAGIVVYVGPEPSPLGLPYGGLMGFIKGHPLPPGWKWMPDDFQAPEWRELYDDLTRRYRTLWCPAEGPPRDGGEAEAGAREPAQDPGDAGVAPVGRG